MTNDTLSVSAISGYLESTDPFPIDFDQAWQWLGFSTKGNAKRILDDQFASGIDFEVFIIKDKNPKGGRPIEKIMLSVDCLKCLGMMAGTAKGKEVRQYFLECERTLKASTTCLPANATKLDQVHGFAKNDSERIYRCINVAKYGCDNFKLLRKAMHFEGLESEVYIMGGLISSFNVLIAELEALQSTIQN